MEGKREKLIKKNSKTGKKKTSERERDYLITIYLDKRGKEENKKR